jgi:hypothetical protein
MTLDPTTLPAPLLSHFGGASDVYLVRLLGQSPAQARSECDSRARGWWDANECESCAAYQAMADIIRESEGLAAVGPGGWTAGWYAYFRGTGPMPGGRGWF